MAAEMKCFQVLLCPARHSLSPRPAVLRSAPLPGRTQFGQRKTNDDKCLDHVMQLAGRRSGLTRSSEGKNARGQ